MLSRKRFKWTLVAVDQHQVTLSVLLNWLQRGFVLVWEMLIRGQQKNPLQYLVDELARFSKLNKN